ncbi:MAG TPA: biotin--[acetyl-CoA-carboxylase] ligase [Solirubrobacteraceae bacterium]|nr:biotin--[acetyl-CoA-carboxylase] ligase [Solirubrobacteraceae bacterium]
MPPTLGHPRLHLRRTDSTSDRARALAIAGAPHGTLVTAAEQTAGRGRQGRRWSAPAGSALLASLVLRGTQVRDGEVRHTVQSDDPADTPVRSARLPSLLPLIAAVAVCDVVGPDAQIKWPNDIVLVREQGLAKLAGILAEGRSQDGWAVLGIGLNVAVRLDDLPAELRLAAATLGEPPDAIEPTLARLLRALERRLAEPDAALRAYRASDALRDREIAWSAGRGRAEGIDGEGRLVVALDGGGHTALDSGEVHLRPSL